MALGSYVVLTTVTGTWEGVATTWRAGQVVECDPTVPDALSTAIGVSNLQATTTNGDETNAAEQGIDN